MRIALVILGFALIAFSATDALWTTLWVDGHAGPFTRRHTSLMRDVMLRLSGHNHRALSLTGPIILVQSVLLWALLSWAGWVVLFSSSPTSLLHLQTHVPSSLVDRIYFTGYTMFTLGNGDFTPNGNGWELATAAASLNGLFMLTLSVTYLLSVIEAVVAKRAFGSQVWSLGTSSEDAIVHCWDGASFRMTELALSSLTEQLSLVTEQHQAYPMLHFYHEAERKQSVSTNVAVFSEMLLLFAHGVAPEVRPAPAVLWSAQRTVEEFLDSLKTAYVNPSDNAAPGPRLEWLRAAGIPTVSDAEFDAALRARDERRRLLCGFLESERREWPR